jgi:hypothetical protein
MGYDSIRGMEAYRMPTEGRMKHFYGDELFFVTVDVADSNLITPEGDMVCYRYLFRLGREWEVMQNIIHFSAGAEGGGLKMNKRNIKPETLISRFRKVLKEAAEINAPSDIGIYNLEFRVDRCSKEDRFWREDEMRPYLVEESEKNRERWGERYSFPVASVEDLDKYFDVGHYNMKSNTYYSVWRLN